MAATGYTPIYLYYSSTTTNQPSVGNLGYGELAINIADGKLFYKNSSNVISQFGITLGSTVQTLGSTVSNINDVVIGNSSAAAGTFTDITATGNATFGGATATSITSYSGSNWNYSQLNLIRKAADIATPRLLSFMLDGDSLTSTTIGDYPAIWGIYNAAPTTSSTSASLQAQMGFASYYGFKWYVNGTNVVNVLSSGSLCVGNTTDAGAGNLCVGSQSGGTATPGNILMDGSYTSTPAWNSLKFYLYKGASESYGITVGSSSDVQYWAGSSTSGIHRWYTKQTEQMRIHASGGVSIGNVTDPGAANLYVTGVIRSGTNSNYAQVVSEAASWCYQANNTSDGNLFRFSLSGVTKGYIYTDGTNTFYATSSDYRLKDIDGPLTGSGEFIDSLKPKQGTWKENGSKFVGFLAHELQETSPSSVRGQKDAVDENGEPVYQSIQASSAEVIANIVAELQSLRLRVAELEGK